MKLKVFQAADGDCLLLTSADGRHALIDGGRTDSFQRETWPFLRSLAKSKKEIDLVVVSHIDADHISGILWLMRAVAAWAVYDYQTTEGKNPDFVPPSVERPPTIKKLWHNSWHAQLGELAGPIEALVSSVSDALSMGAIDLSATSGRTTEMVEELADLATSIPDGVELRRIVEDETPVERNKPFKDLVLLQAPPYVEKLGTAKLTVIGPARKHLEKLRDEWRKWLLDKPGSHNQIDQAVPAAEADNHGSSLGEGMADLARALATERSQIEQFATALTSAAEIITATDPSKVTPPNRASITLLAEEAGRTCLLTGDAAEEEILEGLTAAGRIVNDRFHCNVIKIQHHGSEFNLSERFASTVVGDDYIFCADGAHNNPDPSVVRTIVETRLAADPSPFKLWFNTSPERTQPNRRTALRAAIKEATKAAAKQPTITVEILDDAKPFFELSV